MIGMMGARLRIRIHVGLDSPSVLRSLEAVLRSPFPSLGPGLSYALAPQSTVVDLSWSGGTQQQYPLDPRTRGCEISMQFVLYLRWIADEQSVLVSWTLPVPPDPSSLLGTSRNRRLVAWQAGGAV
ncbi:hypothetical protein BDK51DRAFT_45056 [Blyttiomyces helicus]|uniref:Uncharacterized protein n=1 Tax=Blyttiomyces helicus TaxID=388810 RepID=A0A4P9VWZ7_9FUNG|nr:hypothetical protein BDK51DRAFT_45056 [Blyttiomyces helicus]|eukprot:RKO84241.1 hypothetical protein BDK51DRAFT_45056 [Blyttiomyces helicus]